MHHLDKSSTSETCPAPKPQNWKGLLHSEKATNSNKKMQESHRHKKEKEGEREALQVNGRDASCSPDLLQTRPTELGAPAANIPH